MADLPPYPGTPRWAKVFWIILAAFLLMVIAMVFIGNGHAPSGDHGPPGGHTLFEGDAPHDEQLVPRSSGHARPEGVHE